MQAADLAAAKRAILQKSQKTPLLAAFAKKATVSSVSNTGLPPSRKRVTPTRLGGVIESWDGVNGWVRPHQPVPNLGAHQGQLFCLHAKDVLPSGVELPTGCEVTFFVYRGSAGFGAESCIAYKGTQLGAAKSRADTGTIRGGGGDLYGPRWEPSWNETWHESGPDLPRKRVTEAAICGEVVEWSGQHGWIQPEEELEHPLAKRRRGRLYVHRRDMQSEEAPDVGALVLFQVYADSSGLGAEEVFASA